MSADRVPTAAAAPAAGRAVSESVFGRSPWERWGARNLGIFTVAPFVATWPLWWGGTTFPVVPWFRWLLGVPLVADRGLVVVLVAAATAVVLAPRRGRSAGLAVLLASLGLLVLLDQHRFQPWAWLILLEALAILTLPSRTAQRWIRALVISLYVWSAVSKLDAAFLAGRGPWLLTGLLEGLGLETGLLPPQRLARAAWLLPMGELATAAAIAVPRMRWIGKLLALGMHASLLVALGPWGHDHHLGVLLWNAFFLVQTLLLFGQDAAETSPAAIDRTPARELVVKGILAIAMAAPVLEPWGLWDHWPAWAVYSDRPEVVRMWIPESAVGTLPAGLSHAPPDPFSDQCEVRFDDWSFSTERSPVYPQTRYRLALARAVASRLDPGTPFRITIEATPDRRSGMRLKRELSGRDELLRECDSFFFSTAARPDQ